MTKCDNNSLTLSTYVTLRGLSVFWVFWHLW